MFARPSLIAAGLALGLATLLPGQADAHRRWIMPTATVIAGESTTVSVDAAVSNALFAFDHAALGLDDLKIVGPDGQPVTATIIGRAKARSVFDVPLNQQGTYRIAVASEGAMGFYELNGERKRVRGKTVEEARAAVPVGATKITINKTSSRTETFVTLGGTNTKALEPVKRGLELSAITHPNSLAAGEAAQFRLLLDGQPTAGLDVELVAGGSRYRDEAGIQAFKTDAQGVFTVNVDTPGMYFLEASASAGDTRSSYTAVLEFLPL